MKTIRVVTIVCWVVVAATMLGLAGWFLTGTMFGIRPARSMPFIVGFGTGPLTGPFNVVGEYSADPAGINNIQVNWTSGEVTIIPHDGNMIEITESAQRELRDDERMHVSVSGGTVEIRFVDRGISTINMRIPQKRLEVLVPQALSENLNILGVGSVSGRVNVDNMAVASLDVGTTSGAINVSNITSREVDLNSTSGRIEVINVVAENMTLDSTSGAVNVDSSRANDMEIDTLSGAITVTDSAATAIDLDSTSGRVSASGVFDGVEANSLSGAISIDSTAVGSVVNAGSNSGRVELLGDFTNVNVRTSSGSITVRSNTVPETINAESSSGRMSITVPNVGYVSVSHSTGSGRFNSEIPVLVQSTDARFTLSTRSGNINIYELR